MDVRSDGLDAGSGCGEEVINPTDSINFDPVGSDPVASPEPSQAELAQCQAEVGTLLSIIAELNKKMGGLKLPRESDDLRPPGPDGPLVPESPDLLTHGLASGRDAAPGTTSEPPVTSRGGSVNVWSELQEALSAVEDSISSRRTWAVPLTASDQDQQTEHRLAAQESWVQATQILEEMEREFGITYPSGLPSEERQQYQRDVLDLHQNNVALRNALRSRQEEQEVTQSALNQMDEEKNRLQDKLVGLYKVWRSGSLSPPYSSSSSSSGGALSPDVASPPYPGSPLLLRRPRSRSSSALSAGEDASLSSGIASLGSPGSSVNLESETERMQRCIERLKSRNERLTAALERRKGESEQISMTLSRHEADSSALQMALRYCEECEEAYSELLSLYEVRRRQGLSLWTDPAETVCDGQYWPDIPGSRHSTLKTEELSTSFSTAGGNVESETQSHTRQRGSELVEREAALRQQIEHLQEDRAAVCLPKPGPGGEGKLSPDTGTLAGTRGGQAAKEGANPNDTKRERAALLHELVSVREEMSELRGLIRLTEKERRCLDWSLMAQKAQDAAGALISESLGEELEDRKAEQRVAENVAKLVNDGNLPGPRNRTLFRELQAVLQREQGLKRRISTVRDSLDTALSDSASRRKDSEEQITRLVQAHCKATGLYRNARRKYREQLWRLEHKMSAMSDSHHSQLGALKATLEALEWRREETIL